MGRHVQSSRSSAKWIRSIGERISSLFVSLSQISFDVCSNLSSGGYSTRFITRIGETTHSRSTQSQSQSSQSNEEMFIPRSILSRLDSLLAFQDDLSFHLHWSHRFISSSHRFFGTSLSTHSSLPTGSSSSSVVRRFSLLVVVVVVQFVSRPGTSLTSLWRTRRNRVDHLRRTLSSARTRTSVERGRSVFRRWKSLSFAERCSSWVWWSDSSSMSDRWTNLLRSKQSIRRSLQFIEWKQKSKDFSPSHSSHCSTILSSPPSLFFTRWATTRRRKRKRKRRVHPRSHSSLSNESLNRTTLSDHRRRTTKQTFATPSRASASRTDLSRFVSLFSLLSHPSHLFVV